MLKFGLLIFTFIFSINLSYAENLYIIEKDGKPKNMYRVTLYTANEVKFDKPIDNTGIPVKTNDLNAPPNTINIDLDVIQQDLDKELNGYK
ncbi:hypothetical protein [Acinetobacter sp. Marseille-Q1618]|uniref:hypothetical protein n=1 Tax=Acinetobacter sp. Marseille-Q1618 TaxID=2697502 RepID=UPI00156DD1C1|nr:hypothetical protein [Acinetobacter sp. Marseille-Q1618]